MTTSTDNILKLNLNMDNSFLKWKEFGGLLPVFPVFISKSLFHLLIFSMNIYFEDNVGNNAGYQHDP
jgi:amino acid permease